jgi:photolyase PhrII
VSSLLSSIFDNLPPWLHTRCRVSGSASNPNGMILYWMRFAMRDHENPALDVALWLADALTLPVQVVQVLAYDAPYASDRHHLFFIEGARDVAQALRRRNIPHAFHLQRAGTQMPALVELSRRSRAVVTELMPVQPFQEAARQLSQHSTVVEVDTSCLFPMTTGLSKAPTRAFEFRHASQQTVSQALEQGYPPFAFSQRDTWRAPSEPLPFEPVQLESAALNDLIAHADVDHGVSPIPDSPGGTEAGYRRWSAYLQDSLFRYAKTRNDVLADSTSRMSAYLHLGQVSPFRLASDLFARLATNPGAEKLLDELLVWRELAYHHAFHVPDHARVSSLPAWALQTLQLHQSDPRAEQPSWEQLAHARTEDRFWNACQRSLLAHGELHNNVRMTWGKRLLEWTETAEDALALLLDLNNRYALDGSDPASYAGIAWCLGAFDRPFAPEMPILGRVRPRPTAVHAERLNVADYEKWVRRSPFQRKPRVAIVGSGVAGLAAARVLQNHNVEVVVFDKGRTPGGRLVSRELCGVPFDYGAQYFTAKSPSFQQLVDALSWERELEVWSPRTVRLIADAVTPAQPELQTSPWFVAPRGFSAFMARLAQDLTVKQSRQVTKCTQVTSDTAPSWVLTFADGTVEMVDELLLTVPGPQVEALLGHPVSMPRTHEPCWSLSVAFATALPVPFDAAFVDVGALGWICRETSKPGRQSSAVDVWTLHASTAFSKAWLEADTDLVRQKMTEALFELSPFKAHANIEIVGTHEHRWRFARAVSTAAHAGEQLSYRYQHGLGIAGDGLGGGRVESAYLSGVALAGALLRSLAATGAGSRHVTE